MKAIRDIIESMNNTLDEAEEYYDMFRNYKDDYPKMANVALEMASNHINLYNKWHDVVVVLINDYKMKNDEVPATMKELWNYEHKKLTEEFEELAFKVDKAKRM